MKRWLKWAGIAFGGLTLLIVALYLEENWRGARLWAQTKAQYEAKGFNFDPKSLIPPPVPDEQNFAKSEIWQRLLAASDSKNTNRPKSELLEARKTFLDWRSKNKAHANWKLGQSGITPPMSLFEAATQEIQQVHEAADRPYCQFLADLSHTFPADNIQSELGPTLNLATVLSSHAVAALDANATAISVRDISTIFKAARGYGDSPYLISGLVACSMTQAPLPVIWEGIESHLWSDSELAKLQAGIRSVDLLQMHQHTVRSELCFFVETLNWLQSNRKQGYEKASRILVFKGYEPRFEKHFNPWAVIIYLSASGWYDESKAAATSLYIENCLYSVDCSQRRYFSERLFPPARLREQRSYQPIYGMMSSTLPSLTSCTETFVQGQAWLDLARVACGLERYRLANGKYPATLAELEPKFIDQVPHDLCNGEPLHYRVAADGNYALYSVGFNGVDDGGKIVMRNESFSLIDLKQGDWVWPRSRK